MTTAGSIYTVTLPDALPIYSLSATSGSYAATAGSGSVGVTTTTGCAWTAVAVDSWITVTSGGSGSGSGTVGYSVAANTLTTSRTGTMTIAGSTYIVSQAAAGPGNDMFANAFIGTVGNSTG